MRKCKKFLSGLMAACLLVSFLNVMSGKVGFAANGDSSVESQIHQLEQRQQQLAAESEKLKKSINTKKAYRANILEQWNLLQSQMNILTERMNLLNQEIASKQARMNEIQQNMDENMSRLGERLKAIYKAGDVPELAIFLNVQNFEDLLDKADMVQKLSRYDADLIDELNENRAQIEQEKVGLEGRKKEVEDSKSVLDAKVEALNKIKRENDQIANELLRRESKLRAQISANEARKRSLQNDIFNGPARNANHFTKRNGRYAWPVPGRRNISSGWGGRRRHNGIDIPGPAGTPIVATADGVVVEANSSSRWGHGWGYYVLVLHDDGKKTIYAHLSRVLARPGQRVQAGQIVGNMGSTGHSTGNHLHFGVMVNGRWVNPMLFL